MTRVLTALSLLYQATLISAFSLGFPDFNSTTGLTEIRWDPETSSCLYITIQHQCLPDKFVTWRTPVRDKYKLMTLPVDWIERLIGGGTNHCQAVAQCEDGFPNVWALAAIDLYLSSDSEGRPLFTSFLPSPSPSPSPTMQSEKKHVPLGPVLGGTLGGLAALSLVAALLIFRRRRNKSEEEKLPTVEQTPTLPTPSTPSSPFPPGNVSSIGPNLEGYHIDTADISPKIRMMAVVGSPISAARTAVEEPIADTGRGGGVDEENRRQIIDLNSRIRELEASRGEGEMEGAPPVYSASS